MAIPSRPIAFVLSLALAGFGAGAAAQSPAPSAPTPLFDDTAIQATPIPGGIVDPEPTTWDHVTIWPDGRTLTVAFWNGAEACSGLDRLELADDAGTLRITPWVGKRVDAAGADCAAIRQLYSTIAALDAPILAGGDTGPFEVGLPPAGAIAERAGPFASLGGPSWDAVDLGPDGRTGWAFWTGGDPACDGFDRVAVDDTGPVVRLAIVTGQLASAPEVCTLIATSQRAAFALPAPIILGGASPA